MDTPIRMRVGKMEISFWGEITKLRLMKFILEKQSLILTVVSKIKGREFLMLANRLKTYTKIIALHMATILHVDTDKLAIRDLCMVMFKNFLLEELEFILENIDRNQCIQRRSDYRLIHHLVQFFHIQGFSKRLSSVTRIDHLCSISCMF